MFPWNRIARLFRGSLPSGRRLRFENLETRLPAAADFNWPEVVYMHLPEVADSAWGASSAIPAAPVQPQPLAADGVFAALDVCGDFLNATGRSRVFADSDSIITAAVG